jgi:peroxiredoxin
MLARDFKRNPRGRKEASFMKTIGILMVGALSTLALAARTTDESKREDKMEAKAEIGKPAPAFELKDLDGKTIKLSDYKGKTVVLEWFNPECPVVVANHTKGSLKDAAATATKDGVVWLAINSGGAGMQGADPEKNKKMREEWKLDHPILLDPDGVAGRAYGAKNTPHMYIIDAKGNLAYRGAIDSAEDDKDGEPVNYVATALGELKEGKAVTKSDTKAYGCSVKYAKAKEKEKEKEKVKG